MTFEPVAVLDELWLGEIRGVQVRGVKVLLVHSAAGVRAFEDRCPHKGVPLSQGKLEGSVLTCGVHGWTFEVEAAVGVNPAGTCLRRFPVKVEGPQILVDVEAVEAEGL